MSVSQGFGLSQLREGASTHSLRSILCALTLLFYHTYVSLILGKSRSRGPGRSDPRARLTVGVVFRQAPGRETWWRPRPCWSRTNRNTPR